MKPARALSAFLIPISAGIAILLALLLHNKFFPDHLESIVMGSKNSNTSGISPENLVEDAIRDNPVVVFSKSYCPYCVKGKNAIAAASRSVENYPGTKIFELDRMGASGSAIQDYLAKKTGRRSVPNVFVAGKSIGGGDDTVALHSRGKLADLLRNAIAAYATATSGATTDSVDKIVDDAIAKFPVVLFGKSYCPHCKKAKAALGEVGATVDGFTGTKVFEMDERDDGAAMQEYLKKKTGRSTVPNVFVGGKNVGGGDDTVALAKSGKLATKMKEAVATYASASVKDIVENAIATHPVVIFSKDYCPYCKKAKASIREAGAKVTGFGEAKVFEMNLLDNGAEMQAYLREKTGRDSVPNVFIGGEAVGGGDETAGYLASGVLPQMIAAAVNVRRSGTARTSKPATLSVASTDGTDTVLFGAGCFWGVELAFQRERGVVRTEVGYANGNTEKVTYKEVCSGRSGHAEVVKVWYRPAEVSFEHLLSVWEKRHDVTSKNKQGNDRGTQYRSALFYSTEEQKKAVEKWMNEAKKGYAGSTVHTDVGPIINYCAAEDYHQQYLEKGGQSAEKESTEKIYCYGLPNGI